MLLAKARGELLLKTLAAKQAAYLQAAMRQTIMAVPLIYARRILNLSDAAQAHRILKELSISLLNELRDLPQKVTDPNWLRTLEDDEPGPPLEPDASTPTQAKAKTRKR
jgi:hypothetical protein